jgi:acetolactate synthase-1/2/3 large subunit
MNGANLLVAALENEGVKQIFGVPGEENLDIVEALRRSTIKLVVTRHEQAAAFMAATHGRLTGKAGVCPSALGPGALDLTTGAAYAQLELPNGDTHALAGHQFCSGSQVPCGVR